MKTFSVNFFLRRDKVNMESEAPIMMRITIDGKRADIPIHRSFNTRKWVNGKPTGARPEVIELKTYMESLRIKAFDVQRQLLERKEEVTASMIKDHFVEPHSSKVSLIEMFRRHNADLNELMERKQIAFATVQRYNTTLRHAQKYLQHRFNRSDIRLTELNYDFIAGFEHYLKTVSGCNHNSTIKYIKNLRKIVNLAVKLDMLHKDPFGAYSASLETVDREFLTDEELQRIMQLNLDLPRLDRVRDYFVFACFTGLAYVDVGRLTIDNLETGNDGKLWISIKREKTNVPSRIPLLKPAQDILAKYEEERRITRSKQLLAINSNQKTNAYLKEIADLCGIHKNLTFHIARHTFATTVTLNNNVSIDSVQVMLGHRSVRTTQIYAKTLHKKIADEMAGVRRKYE